MNIDFPDRRTMLQYVHRTIVVDVSRIARGLMVLGDVFPDAPEGMYDELSGNCISRFGIPNYYLVDRKRVWLDSEKACLQAKGVVFSPLNKPLFNIPRAGAVKMTSDLPTRHRARRAAVALYGDVLLREAPHSSIGYNVPQFDNDVIYLDDIRDSAHLSSLLNRVEDSVLNTLIRTLDDYQWHDKVFLEKNSNFVVEVGVDIRIKKYYEELFDRQEEEEDRRLEYGDLWNVQNT